jgi:hypothetical protein
VVSLRCDVRYDDDGTLEMGVPSELLACMASDADADWEAEEGAARFRVGALVKATVMPVPGAPSCAPFAVLGVVLTVKDAGVAGALSGGTRSFFDYQLRLEDGRLITVSQ